MKFEDIVRFKNSKEWIEFTNYYKDLGVTEQLGLYRYEDVSTNFLESVLKKDNIYGYGTLPIKLLLELISEKSDILKDIKTSDYESYDVLISNDRFTRRADVTKDIPDMFITFKINNKDYLILLEAKLLSDLSSPNQCKKYRENLKTEYKDYEKIFLYLTIDGSPSDDPNNYINITYQDLIDKIYNPLIDKESKKVVLTIEEYLKTFNVLYYNDGLLDIPLTKKGKELTLAIWHNHKEAIKEILENNNSIEEFDKEDLKLLFININKLREKKEINKDINNKELLDIISRIASNIKKCNKIDTEYYTDSEFVYRVFKKITKDYPNLSYDDLKCINQSIRYQYIYSKEEYEDLKYYKGNYQLDYYGKLTIRGEDYYYWVGTLTENEIRKLINNIESDNRFSQYKDNRTFERVDKIKYR